MKIRKIARIIVCILLVSCIAMPTMACNRKNKYDNESSPLVIATQELDQLFNPFYATSAYDTSVVGMTQISMLSSDRFGNVYVGEDEPTVVKAYSVEITDKRTQAQKADPEFKNSVTNIQSGTWFTQYKFLLKNGIKFSDGQPLTIKDVLFNLYFLVDPAYVGSSTLYSTDITGLTAYRTQNPTAGSSQQDAADRYASAEAAERIYNLIEYYYDDGDKHPGGNIYGDGEEEENLAKIQSDFEIVRRVHREELYTDWNNASSGLEDSKQEYTVPTKLKDKSKKAPGTMYANAGKELVTEDWQLFCVREGVVGTTYDDDDKDILTAIDYAPYDDLVKSYNENKSKVISDLRTELGDKAEQTFKDFNNFDELKDYIVYNVYEGNLGDVEAKSNIYNILNFWATGNTVRQEFMAQAMSEYFDDLRQKNGGSLPVTSISGVTYDENVREFKEGTVEDVDGKTSGELTPVDLGGEAYTVLNIRVNGVDPKAIWNFGFTVTPMHYYSNPELANISGDTGFTAQDGYAGFNPAVGHYGFPFSNADYFNKVVKTRQVPVGAGTYKATTYNGYNATGDSGKDDSNIANLKVADLGGGGVFAKENGKWVEKIAKKNTTDGFFGNQQVFYIRNGYFNTTGKNVNNAKIKLFRYRVVASNRLYDAVKDGSVHYADPSAKVETVKEIDDAIDNGSTIRKRTQSNNGYGYIGINPKYVRDLKIRQAIMYAMDTSLISNFYGDLAEIIHRPMTTNSWAYPAGATPYYLAGNTGKFDVNAAKAKINELVHEAGYTSAGEGKPMTRYSTEAKEQLTLKYTFTVAGGETDHPAFATMSLAMDILNQCGFEIKLVTDSQALSKLASGTLQVWAAAWSSTIDPDMYQVYHMDSKATSILNWGYDEILGLNGKTAKGSNEEKNIINHLSELIDAARETTIQSDRKNIYSEALDTVMSLAVELPTYQRDNLYVFDSAVLDEATMTPENEIGAYQGPIEKMWILSFVGNK